MPPFPGFIGPSYQSPSLLIDGEQTMNWWLARMQAPGATVPYALFPSPGTAAFLLQANGPTRGLYGNFGRAWSVAKGDLNEIFANMTVTKRGTVIIDVNPATFTTNGDAGEQLFVTAGNHGYIEDLITHVVTDVVSGAFMGGFLDGFFLALDTVSSTLKISNNEDGLTWDPTQIYQRSTDSDRWKAMKVNADLIYLIGEYTSDVLYNAGNSPFPFAPIKGSGAAFPYGTEAPFSVQPYRKGVIFLAQSHEGGRTIQMATGQTTNKISTDALDAILAKYAKVSDAEAWCYEEFGILFYVLNLPTVNKTWVFNEITGWNEGGTWDSDFNRFDVWTPRCHASIFGIHLVGDRTTSEIYQLSSDFATEAGGLAIRRVRRTPLIESSSRRRMFFPNLQLILDCDPRIASGQGADPQIMLRTTTNGRTWGTERRRRAGGAGQFRRTVDFRQLGSGYVFGVEVSVSDPVPWRLLDALMDQAA